MGPATTHRPEWTVGLLRSGPGQWHCHPALRQPPPFRSEDVRETGVALCLWSYLAHWSLWLTVSNSSVALSFKVTVCTCVLHFTKLSHKIGILQNFHSSSTAIHLNQAISRQAEVPWLNSAQGTSRFMTVLVPATLPVSILLCHHPPLHFDAPLPPRFLCNPTPYPPVVPHPISPPPSVVQATQLSVQEVITTMDAQSLFSKQWVLGGGARSTCTNTLPHGAVTEALYHMVALTPRPRPHTHPQGHFHHTGLIEFNCALE